MVSQDQTPLLLHASQIRIWHAKSENLPGNHLGSAAKGDKYSFVGLQDQTSISEDLLSLKVE